MPKLAREVYALMLYVSSLVRYRPTHLDPQVNGHQAWLLDAFTQQAEIPLLEAALAGILGRPFLFYSKSAFRL